MVCISITWRIVFEKKIFGILICIILIITIIPVVESQKDNKLFTLSSNNFQNGSYEGWTEIQKLISSNSSSNFFGYSVSLNGDTALIGAPWYKDALLGTAYIFTRNGIIWTQQQQLFAADGAWGGLFGISVSLDGNDALIGAQGYDNYIGAVYVFTLSTNTWVQKARLQSLDGERNFFGCSVSLDGDTALIGASADGDNGEYSGAAYVFTRNGTSWTQQAKLLASDGEAYDYFGNSVSLSNNTALIGAFGDDDYKGSVYVFTRNGTTWTQQAKLLASNGPTEDNFGYSISLFGDTALIGAPSPPYKDNKDVDSGSAYVFIRSGTNWTQQQQLFAADGAWGGLFGISVSLDGDTALVGADWDDDNGNDSGSVYVFNRVGTNWTQRQKLLTSDGIAGDDFGISVSLDGDTALIGAFNKESAYLFTKFNLTFSIAGGSGVNIKITNKGKSNAFSVPWKIHVQGGILKLFNKTMNGKINLQVNETKTVGTGRLFGLGRITITVIVAKEEEIIGAIQFFIFSIVK